MLACLLVATIVAGGRFGRVWRWQASKRLDASLGVEDGGNGSDDGAYEAQASQKSIEGPLAPPQLP